MDIDTHELAWAAGFFDGEGGTYLTRGIKRRPSGKSSEERKLTLAIVQASEDDQLPAVLLRFQRAVGGVGGIYVASYRTERHLPKWQFKTGRMEHVQAIVAMLWKFLGPVKRAQATAALNGWNAWRVRGLYGSPRLTAPRGRLSTNGTGGLLNEPPIAVM
jgi:hypothetical protein